MTYKTLALAVAPVWVCDLCAALVWDIEVHDQFHERVADLPGARYKPTR